MIQGFHLVSSSIPGYIVPEGKCSASGAAALLPSTSFGGVKVILNEFPTCRLKTFSVTCQAGNNNRRNPDFSRHHKGSSRGRNRQHQERGNAETFEEPDPLPSKNGSLLSLSSNQRYSATATPGRREKEIVELFRKVQAQLRARAAIKEEKKIEAAQGGQGDRGTVDSLLKLLRKHSAAQGKKSSREEEFNSDQPARGSSFQEEPSSDFFSSSSIPTSDEVLEPDPIPSRRPTSSFRRRSPVPRVKFQPVFSADEGSSSRPSLISIEKKKANIHEPELDLVALEEPGEESSGELSDSIDTETDLLALEEPGEESSGELSDSTDTDEIEEEAVQPLAAEITNLASLKLSELRDIAKSRGLKGYSKLKKAILVGLLGGDQL